MLSYSPVGLVEAAMVAAPEAGVFTLSMAQSYLYVLFDCLLLLGDSMSL